MLQANSIGSPFIELLTVESTNNYAMDLVYAGLAQHGTAVFAHEQTKGKGQRDKEWLATKNENIILSIIVHPFSLQTDRVFLLSQAVAVGVQTFFNHYTKGYTTIKWPNDIFWNDRKAGGILIENIIQGKTWKYAIIGIGLNLNQTRFPQVFQKAVSLKQITGKTYDPVYMAKDLIHYLDAGFRQMVKNPDAVVHAYHLNLYKLQEKARLKRKDEIVEGIIKGVTADGQLIVQHQTEELFRVGEVQWL